MKVIFLVVTTLMVSMDVALAYKSSHMKDFKVLQCFEKKCVEATGDVAFMSASQDFMVARTAKLVTSEGEFSCEAFRMNLRSQEIVCDNTQTNSGPTLIIDSKLKVLTLTYNSGKKSL